MSVVTWETVHAHLVAGRPEELREALALATEGERKLFGRRLLAYVRDELIHPEWDFDGTSERSLPVLAVAAVACLPSDAAVGTLLNRAPLREQWGLLPVALMVAAAADRGVPWLGAVVPRLAERLPREPWPQQWRTVAELVLATGAPVPTGDRFVEGWVTWLVPVPWERPDPEGPTVSRQTRERLLWGPFLDVLLPRVFEIDQLGNVLAGGGDRTVLDSLVALAAEGRLERAALLDGCLTRLHHPDRPGALRCFSTLHNQLAPTLDELTERAADCADLAVIASSPVAGLAQVHLLALEKAGRLDLDLLVSTSPPVLERTEQVVVKRQLKLLEAALVRYPDRAGEILATVAGVFRHPVFDLQRRGVALVARYGAELDVAGRSEMARSATDLSPDLLADLQRVIGVPVEGSAPSGVPTASKTPAGKEPPGPQREAFPPPIDSLDELQVALRRVGSADWIADERTRAALVTLSLDEPVAVRRLLTEAMARLRAESWPGVDQILPLQGAWPRDARHFGTPEFAAHQAATDWILATTLRGERPPGLDNWSDIPYLVRQFRTSEVVAGLAVPSSSAAPRQLVATPTDVTGRIEPEVLLGRIAAAEAEGWQPYPIDLDQALLRLPRRVDPEIGIRAAALSSPAAGRLAAWLADGGPGDPLVVVRGRRRPTAGTYRADRRPGGGRYVVLTPVEPVRTPLQRVLFTMESRHDRILGGSSGERSPIDVFPDHREVVLAWALTDRGALHSGDLGLLLPAGPDHGGPAGAATTLLLAYTFSADEPAKRVAAVDAMLSLAAAGNLDGAELGEQLGGLIADGLLTLPRVAPGLVETARAGAATATWDVLTTLLPYVIGGKPAGLLPLLTLAVDLADRLQRRDRIPGLDEVAARKGSGGVVTQARRLQRVLADTTPGTSGLLG